jgi:hypothetical protein
MGCVSSALDALGLSRFPIENLEQPLSKSRRHFLQLSRPIYRIPHSYSHRTDPELAAIPAGAVHQPIDLPHLFLSDARSRLKYPVMLTLARFRAGRFCSMGNGGRVAVSWRAYLRHAGMRRDTLDDRIDYARPNGSVSPV